MLLERKPSFGAPRLRPTAVAGLAVFALALPVFALLKVQDSHDYAISEARAVAIARADSRVAEVLAGHGGISSRVTPLDETRQRVTFSDGPRTLLDAAVSRNRVTHVASHPAGTPESGSSVANAVPVLLLLAAVFALATATLPLPSLRNLDVLVLSGAFTATIWLLNQNLVRLSVIVSFPALAYLAARALRYGLGPPDPGPRTSLLWHLTGAWSRAQRVRMMRIAVAAAAAIVLMVVPSSTGASDVAFASAAGATQILDGAAPYGNIPSFILHGDTYPLLTYLLYLPGAALMPVQDAFSDPTGALLVAAAATLLAAWMLCRLGTRLQGADERDGVETAQFAGLRLALAWLTFPPVVVSASGGGNDVVLAACVAASLACFSHRAASATALGVAAWVKVAPALALPLWLARLRGGATLRAAAGLAGVSAALVGLLLALGGPGAVSAMAEGLGFQLDRGSLRSPWLSLGLGSLQPLMQAALLAAVAAATVAVLRDPNLAADLRRMAALLAAVMLLAQAAANYWTWSYLPWVLVPLMVSLLAPGREAEFGAKPKGHREIGPPSGAVAPPRRPRAPADVVAG